MANPNLALLTGMARAMGPLFEQVVFVGGCATGLLLDDAGLMDVRPTEDVDAIVEVATLAAYHRLAEQLMQRGFKQTMADNTPPFRWYWNRMQLDLVPLDAYATARWMQEVQARGALPGYFEPPLTPAERSVAALEGWILGVR